MWGFHRLPPPSAPPPESLRAPSQFGEALRKLGILPLNIAQWCSRVLNLNISGGCPGVLVQGRIPIVFISIHGVVTQFFNVSFLCVPVHEDTTYLSWESNVHIIRLVYLVHGMAKHSFSDNRMREPGCGWLYLWLLHHTGKLQSCQTYSLSITS